MTDDGHIDLQIPTPMKGGFSAFLQWVKLWMSCVWPFEIIYEYEIEEVEEIHAYTFNRFQRRLSRKSLPSHRSNSSFIPLMPRGLTRGQFLEKCSHYSILGRRRFYFILNWLIHLSRWQRVLICAQVKQLRAFTGLSDDNGGLWAAHIWPP